MIAAERQPFTVEHAHRCGIFFTGRRQVVLRAVELGKPRVRFPQDVRFLLSLRQIQGRPEFRFRLVRLPASCGNKARIESRICLNSSGLRHAMQRFDGEPAVFLCCIPLGLVDINARNVVQVDGGIAAISHSLGNVAGPQIIRNGFVVFSLCIVDRADIGEPSMMVVQQPGLGGERFGGGKQLQRPLQLAQAKITPPEIAQTFFAAHFRRNFLCRLVSCLEVRDGVVVSRMRQANVAQPVESARDEILIA